MGIFVKFVGFSLLIGGLYGLFITIPSLFLNLALDEINPLIMLGIIDSQTPTSMFDLFLSIGLVFIGIFFLKKGDKKNIITRR